MLPTLPQLAYRFKTGELKIETLPKASQKRIKDFAESVSLDQLKAMSEPRDRTPNVIGRSHIHLRNVRSY